MVDDKTPVGNDDQAAATGSETRTGAQGDTGTAPAATSAGQPAAGTTETTSTSTTPDEPTGPTTGATTHKTTDRTADRTADRTGDRDTGREKTRRGTGKKVVAGANAVRSRIASLVWLVAVVCALFLAVGALLIALDANHDNAIVKFVLDVADTLDLDVFGRRSGIFAFDGKDAATKGALVNWGIAAIAYLVVGKIADRIIRP